MNINKLIIAWCSLFISLLSGAQELNYREIAYPNNDTGDVIKLIQCYSVYADVLKVDKAVDLPGDIPFWKVFTVDGHSYSISNYLSGSHVDYLINLKEGSATLAACYSAGGTTDYSKIGLVGNGKFVMPEYVHYDGKQYPVTKILEGSISESRFGGVTSLVISNTVTEIGDNAFRVSDESTQHTPFLTSVVMGNSIKRIGTRAFANQTLLTDVEMNSTVESIGMEAFSNCGIKTIDWKNSIKAMGEGVFSYCDQLQTVSFPCEMDTLPKCTFLMCKNLTFVSLGNKIHVLESYSFAGTEKLTSIEWPANLESFEVSAFGRYLHTDYCGLKKLECPSGLKNISVQAFSGCQLEEIRFNEGLEKIGWEVFDVKFLKDIYCPSFLKVGEQNESPFYLDNYEAGDKKPFDWTKATWEKVTLHVPHNLMQKFHDTVPWSYFAIVDIETDEPFIPSENPSEKVCAKPSIGIDNGELTFTCETEDVEYVTTITSHDVGTLVHRENIKLAGTYTITSYAKREGYKNSDIVKVTLFFLPKEQNEEIGIEDAEVSSRPVLISSSDGTLHIQGAVEGTEITVYDLSGRKLASVKASGTATNAIATKLRKGETAIVRIGLESLKVLISD